jgi:hypothetical protein
MRAGLWEERAAGTTRRVSGSALGVIGIGKIGSLVARDAAALGMRVLAADPVATEEAFAAAGAERAELDDLLAASDVVTLHAPHVRGAAPLLGRKQIALLRPGSILVNAARAELIDIDELIGAHWGVGLGLHGRLGQRAAATGDPAWRRPTSCSRRTRLVLPDARPRSNASPRPRPPRCVARRHGARDMTSC